MVLPESYASCNVTLLTLNVQVAIWLEPFRHRAVEPAAPSVDTARVELNVPALVIAPAAVIAIDGEVMKLSNPVPNLSALNVLFVWAVTLPKFTPVTVFAPVALSVPARLMPTAFTPVVPDPAESVTANVAAVE